MGMLGVMEKDSEGRFVTKSGGESMTKQSFADEVNINSILKRFEKTGMVTHLNEGEPFYGDVSELVGFQDALNVVAKGTQLFMALSAEVRERFANDPARLIAFLDDDGNYEEAVRLGIVNKRPDSPAEAAPVVEPPK